MDRNPDSLKELITGVKMDITETYVHIYTRDMTITIDTPIFEALVNRYNEYNKGREAHTYKETDIIKDRETGKYFRLTHFFTMQREFDHGFICQELISELSEVTKWKAKSENIFVKENDLYSDRYQLIFTAESE